MALFIFVVALCVDLIFFGQQVSILEGVLYLVRYFTFESKWFWLFFLTAYSYFGWKLYQFLVSLSHDHLIERQPFDWAGKKTALKLLFKPVRSIALLALPAAPLSNLLTHMSYELRYSGKDLWLWFADETLFGTQLFIALTNVFYSSALMTTIIFYSYTSLSFVFNCTLIFLFFQRKKKIFRQMVLAFILSIMVSFPIFFSIPCQDPNNFFVKNIRSVVFPEQVDVSLKAYHPSDQAQRYIAKLSSAESLVEKDNTVPISCFPSMHSVWSILIIYFLARYSRRTLFVTTPWIIFLLLGGLYFGQHYGVDYLFGSVVALFSIWLSDLLLKYEARRKEK